MDNNITVQSLVDAGVHFGHLTSKWNPKMHEYIFMKGEGVHLIDLNKTIDCLQKASFALKNIAGSGRKIMFVATKKQAKDIVKTKAIDLGMPYVTERWLGGMLTNFFTVRRSLKKLGQIEKQMKDDTFDSVAKRERLTVAREKARLERLLGGIVDLRHLPSALFVVDVKRENIAVAEARKLNIPVFAMVDTNSDPTDIDFPIPANDDAFKSISIIVDHVSKAIQEGLATRKKEKEKEANSALKEEDKEEEQVVENKLST